MVAADENAGRYGEDYGLVPRGYGAQNCWLLGYPDRARHHVDVGTRLAERLGSPFYLARMRWRAACILQCCGEVRRVEEDTGALVRFCEDEGVVPWLSGAAILHGWARAKGGQGNEGIALMRQGLREWRASGTELMCPYYLGLLAEACADAGRAEEGRRAVLEALAVVAATGERWYESELHRRLGLLTIEGGAKPSEGEAHLREALAMARRQGAKSLELRAAASLARLTGRPRRAEARHALAEVLAWFPEGLDSADVGEARDVLENLA